jgi:hypothetical protein
LHRRSQTGVALSADFLLDQWCNAPAAVWHPADATGALLMRLMHCRHRTIDAIERQRPTALLPSFRAAPARRNTAA